jgi:hypothetical protein
MLSVILLNVVMLSVILLNVVMPRIVVPKNWLMQVDQIHVTTFVGDATLNLHTF